MIQKNKIKVTRFEIDFIDMKHFPGGEAKDYVTEHFVRYFSNRLHLWWDKFRNPQDYKTVDTRDTPVPIFIHTKIEALSEFGWENLIFLKIDKTFED